MDNTIQIQPVPDADMVACDTVSPELTVAEQTRLRGLARQMRRVVGAGVGMPAALSADLTRLATDLEALQASARAASLARMRTRLFLGIPIQ